MPELVCLDCKEELDFLDTILVRRTGETFRLYICHNEECDHYGQIYNDRGRQFGEGDPSGLY